MTGPSSSLTLKEVKQRIKDEDFIGAFEELCEIATAEANYSFQHRLTNLYKSIPAGKLELKPLKLAILSTSTIDHFVDILRFYLARDGYDAEIFIADFNTLHQTVLDTGSGMYEFTPHIVWLFTNHRDVPFDIQAGASDEDAAEVVNSAVARHTPLWETLQANSSAYILQNNADLPLERVFGNFEGSVKWGRLNFLRRFNLELADAAPPGVTIFDIDHLSSAFGKRQWFDERYWYHSQHAFSLDASGQVACQAAGLIRAIFGQTKKCYVLDLDGTLWGGVIGDDGLEGIELGGGSSAGEAFMDFQNYLRQIKERGIILAVCSKNEEEEAKRPFLEHPDMRLRLDDIAVFKANWDNKADNIREIAETLEIGLDSLVFIDNDPVERSLVRGMLPMVSVPELPEEPALFVRALDQEFYVETIIHSDEDKSRGDMYRGNADRKNRRKTFSGLDDFLKDLDMECSVGEFDDMHMPRVAQLINKSNQFHLTTTRYSENDVRKMALGSDYTCRYFKLSDRFGDNGLVSLVILLNDGDGELHVDTWVMSCRVLSRGLEMFVHNEMTSIARANSCQRIVGTYIPTRKNKLVADLYERLGYKPFGIDGDATLWSFEIPDATLAKKLFIRRCKE